MNQRRAATTPELPDALLLEDPSPLDTLARLAVRAVTRYAAVRSLLGYDPASFALDVEAAALARWALRAEQRGTPTLSAALDAWRAGGDTRALEAAIEGRRRQYAVAGRLADELLERDGTIADALLYGSAAEEAAVLLGAARAEASRWQAVAAGVDAHLDDVTAAFRARVTEPAGIGEY